MPTWRSGAAYGLIGLPLAFVALPLYVQWPAFYASTFGVSLAQIGALLLLVRVADAVVDPWLGQLGGRWLDRLQARRAITLASVLLLLGFVALFFPPVQGSAALLAWGMVALVVTYAAYSAATLTHQAWAARLPGGAAGQAPWMAWREGAGLIGVVAASVLPSVAGWTVTAAVLAVLLVAGCLALRGAPDGAVATPDPHTPTGPASDLWAPWRHARWRGLLAVYLLNGIANAIPATLVLFFVRDRLQAPTLEGPFLAVYFLAATVSLPLWVRLSARIGLSRTWQVSMGVGIAAFISAAFLGRGDVAAFFMVCAATGVALGADLVAPPALLAAWLRSRSPANEGGPSASAQMDGVTFGWWGAATKLNLALAAGLVLPGLDVAGYAPGSRDASALWALSVAYCAVPCALKLLALVALQRWQAAAPAAESAPVPLLNSLSSPTERTP